MRTDTFSLFVSFNAFGQERALELLEQSRVADDQPRFDERSLRLHVGPGKLHAILEVPHRMPHLQPDVPQRIQDAVNDLRQIGWRLAVRRDLAGVQEHEINVAVRIEFRAAVTAQRHQCQRRKLLLALRRQAVFCRLP